MDIQKAAVYVSLSSEKQDTDLSISAQFRAIREYAVKHNIDIVKEFVDEAESDRTADRSAFKEMIVREDLSILEIKRIESGHCDYCPPTI
jgi:DNA invertase Pin-like site-specific DNA recombinase